MRKHIHLFAAACLCLLSSCAADDIPVTYRDGVVKITLSTDSESRTNVRAGEDDPQSVISNVHFLLFDGSECILHKYVDNGYSATVEVYSGEYTCYAVTNTGQGDLFSEATTVADLEEKFLYVLPGKDYWETGDPKPGFIMGGKKYLSVGKSGVSHTVPVYRICARIDVVITVDITSEDLEKYNYNFREISLEGLPLKATYCPNKGYRPADGSFSFRDMVFSASDGVVNLSFYMLENLAGGRVAEEDVPDAVKEKYPLSYGPDDQNGKRKYAPANAAYLLIKGQASNEYGDNINTRHYVYFGRNATNDYNVGRNERHKYTVNVKGVSELDIDTRVEAAVDQPEFSNLDPANSYMVHNSGNYFIPATFMGNRKDKPLSEVMQDIDIDESTLAAEFLWTDNKESIWLETIEYADHPDQVNYPGEKIIKFRVRGNPELNVNDRGNTVIALYGYEKNDVNRENPIILWSWHIWLTDKPREVVTGGMVLGTTQDNTDYPATDGTLIIMDRNLGAVSAEPRQGALWRTYGCHYQMGRKDPFPNAKKDGIWFNYSQSSQYDQVSIGHTNEHIKHLKFNEDAPFSEFHNDPRSDFNEKLAPDKNIGFRYLQEGISGLYGARHPMVFATKFLSDDTRWTDKQINAAEGDPLYDVTGAKQDYWNRQKTIHDPCPGGWTIMGISGSYWNRNSAGLDLFSRQEFRDVNNNYLGGFYTQLPGGNTDKVWWPAPGVRSIYGRLANMGQTSVYYMFDHIDSSHGAHVARFLLNSQTFSPNTFTVQGAAPSGSVTVNGVLSQINVGGEQSVGTNQAAVIRCVKVDQNVGNINKSGTRPGLVKID